MNIVFKTIEDHIQEQKACFVFPSEAAANLWARKACGLPGVRSIVADRFIAWDRFKEKAVRVEMENMEAVSALIRKLFAGLLVKKNEEAARVASRSIRDMQNDGTDPDGMENGAGFPLRSLIPLEYADEGSIFADSIAGLLSSLALWEDKCRQVPNYRSDEEDRDFATLKKEYTDFLNNHSLFEPSWVKPPFNHTGFEYFIFFPEAIKDFSEYESLLNAEKSIHLIYIDKAEEVQPLRLYDSSRMEIRAVVMELRKLYEEEKITYEDMAISIPDIECVQPYLLRELSLYSIPYRRHSGRKLTDFGTGRFFPLVSSCVSSNFSFSSVKALVLNEHIPWLNPEMNKRLINFGIDNNCVASYSENGKPVDIWMDAFKLSGKDTDLQNYYRDLKKDLRAMTDTKTFKGIRNMYFSFRSRYFLPLNPLAEDRSLADAVLSRCIEELSKLIELEKKFPDVLPNRPFEFFLSVLKDKEYVPDVRNGGVNIYPYRVAAAAPFAAHFVLNATQDKATVQYQPLSFLRPDKRKNLGIVDIDASATFFRLYRPAAWEEFKPYTWISASAQSFSGWAIPHSYFSGDTKQEDALPPAGMLDPFQEERAYWAALDGAPFPRRIFAVQKQGFDRWRSVLSREAEGQFNYLTDRVPKEVAINAHLKKQVWRKGQAAEGPCDEDMPQALSVSATDLNEFFACPLIWLYRRIFNLKEFSLEARLLDEQSLGILFHRILKELFAQIKAEDIFFKQENLGKYFNWIWDITNDVVRRHHAFRGPLAVPLLVSQAEAISKTLRALLKSEAQFFPGYAVSQLESELEFTKDNIRFIGRLDRVSVSPDDEPVIIDYKTNSMPSQAACTETENSSLRDFQMPMYIKLFEEKNGMEISGAFFFSINKHDVSLIVGKLGRKKKCSREDYQTTMDALEQYIEYFYHTINMLDFSISKENLKSCYICEFKTICRTTYRLNDRILPIKG
ncbi:MAG: PD-(D/E)XK nuclease family protein [Treponema sp.]|jgi:hypothetical protein|nr:PD-(D/E)XK nuclease family protein [Treponema sp.]